jgi:glutamate-1-semialdehyde aminotransferase
MKPDLGNQPAIQWDVDGDEYIDYQQGHESLMLGHGHPAVVAVTNWK